MATQVLPEQFVCHTANLAAVGPAEDPAIPVPQVMIALIGVPAYTLGTYAAKAYTTFVTPELADQLAGGLVEAAGEARGMGEGDGAPRPVPTPGGIVPASMADMHAVAAQADAVSKLTGGRG